MKTTFGFSWASIKPRAIEHNMQIASVLFLIHNAYKQ
jgi:hypothetical protein